jgi:2-methylisocitrate lyase-like PEP mutase family enzyme
VDALIRAIREITRVIDLPVTVDLESGFSDDLAMLATTIEGVIDAGAVGINLEDGSKTPECRDQQAAELGDGRCFVFLEVIPC